MNVTIKGTVSSVIQLDKLISLLGDKLSIEVNKTESISNDDMELLELGEVYRVNKGMNLLFCDLDEIVIPETDEVIQRFIFVDKNSSVFIIDEDNMLDYTFKRIKDPNVINQFSEYYSDDSYYDE